MQKNQVEDELKKLTQNGLNAFSGFQITQKKNKIAPNWFILSNLHIESLVDKK